MAGWAGDCAFRWHRSTGAIQRSYRSWPALCTELCGSSPPHAPRPRGGQLLLPKQVDLDLNRGRKRREKDLPKTTNPPAQPPACCFPHLCGFPSPKWLFPGEGAGGRRGVGRRPPRSSPPCQKMAGQCVSVNNAVMKWQRQAELSMLGELPVGGGEPRKMI